MIWQKVIEKKKVVQEAEEEKHLICRATKEMQWDEEKPFEIDSTHPYTETLNNLKKKKSLYKEQLDEKFKMASYW